MSDLSISGTSYNPYLPVTADRSSSNASASNDNTTSSEGTPVSLLIQNATTAKSGSSGALRAGTGTVSVLSASLGDDGTSIFGSMPSENSAILNKILQTATERYSALQQVITDSASQKTAAIDTQNEAWISVKAQINNAQAAVSSGQDSIKRVSDNLSSIRDSVGMSHEDVEYYAGKFDDMINAISNEADSGGTTSLVGNINRVDYSGNEIEYRNNPSLATSTITGTYVATDYRIKVDDGSVWVPDPGTDTITHYTALQGEAKEIETAGITLTESTSTRTGLKLASYDPATNKITMEVTINPDDPPQIVTGTLQRTGLGLMPSWFYGGLATDADRQRAYRDIDAASVNLTAASGQLQLAANQVGGDQRRADAALDDLTQQSVKVNSDQLDQQQALQAKSSRELSALQTNLQSLASTQSNYLNLLGGAVEDPLSQSLIDIQA